MNTPNTKPGKPCEESDSIALARLTDQIVECIHCGLCLESCPTYVELGREEDSPRGRIYFMRAVAEGKVEIDESVRRHLDVCLGCRACETACPSSVEYGYLLERARTHIEKTGQRPYLVRLGRRMLLEMFTHSGLLAPALFFATLPYRLLGKKPKAPGGIVSAIVGASGKGGDLYLGSYPRFRPVRIPERTPARDQKKMRVGVVEGCVMPVLFSEVNRATVRVLSALACEVVVPRAQGCCGALHVHNGHTEAAARMALRNIEAFEEAGCDVVAINSAGCGSTIKDYANLFPDGSPEKELAEKFAAKVKDISQIIPDLLRDHPMRSLDLTVTYHDACHLAHGQGIRDEPREMLGMIPGLTLVPLPESDHCCGSAGVYSFTEPDMATRLQMRKVRNIESTGADVVATGNPGCQMWIRSGLLSAGSKIQALHPIEIVDMALRDGG